MFRLALSLLSGVCLLTVTAGAASIGTVKSAGDFRLDGATVRGNSTLFDGNLIETDKASSVAQIAGAE